MNRRTVIKWLHWVSLGLITYFYLVEPGESRTDPGGALSTHAGMGLLLAVVAAVWFVMYLRKGLASRPGPKLPGWAKRLHPTMHKALYIGVPVMVGSGALTGLLAPFAISGFGIIPINPGIGFESLHDLASEVHEIIFDGIVIVILAHAAFHLWRHYMLKDNALRIMVPKILHKYL